MTVNPSPTNTALQWERPLDPRESIYQDLPNWLQPILTHIIAKPYAGEPPRQRTGKQQLVAALGSVSVGLTASTLGVSMTPLTGTLMLPALFLGWFLILHGNHKLHLTLRHSCAHKAVFDRIWLNDAVGEFISILTLTMDYGAYKKRHVDTHHTFYGLLQPGDGTHDFLIYGLGLKPGASSQELRRQVWRTLLSPEFHLRQLLIRLKGCFCSPSRRHNSVALLVWGLVLSLVAATHSWLGFLVAWVIPMTVPFQLLLALRLLVEHRWPDPALGSDRRSRHVLGSMTTAIFFADPTPQFASTATRLERLWGWGQWWFRFLTYHLPARALILPGDSPCHDYHHRHPASKNWPNAIYARQQDLDAGCPGWPEPYLESWGFLTAMDEVLKSLSRQPTNLANKSGTRPLEAQL